MCKITIKCDKCQKILNSINHKIRRTEKSINKTSNKDTKILLQGELQALNFCKKKLLCIECVEDYKYKIEEREATNEK